MNFLRSRDVVERKAGEESDREGGIFSFQISTGEFDDGICYVEWMCFLPRETLIIPWLKSSVLEEEEGEGFFEVYDFDIMIY